MPTTSVPDFYSGFELLGPQDGATQSQSAYTATTNLFGQEYEYAPDPFFAGSTEDMMMEQAIHNSYMDMVSDDNDGSLRILDPAPLQEDPIAADWTSIDDMDNMLDFSFLSQPEDQLLLDIKTLCSAPSDESPGLTIVTPATTGYQSSHVFPSQWVAISNHDLKTKHDYEQVWDVRLPVVSSAIVPLAISNFSASQKEVRRGKSKPSHRGAVMKKKKHVSVS